MIDKYAALWPFLGIVAEVVILCIIIFACEKRRAKKAAKAKIEHEKNGTANDKSVVSYCMQFTLTSITLPTIS